MTGVFTSAYYTIVRVLEDRWPWIGSLFLLSKPAATLHVVGAGEPEFEEDYGEGWPPREDEGRAVYDPAPPDGGNIVGQRPDGSADYLGPAHPAYQPPPTGMLRVRKADAGAIPVYRRPPGR